MPTGDVKPHCPYLMPKKELTGSDFLQFCQTRLGVSPTRVQRDLNAWLDEDHGAGDVTLFAALEDAGHGSMFIVAKQDFVLCGLQLMAQVFRTLGGGQISIYSDTQDGKQIARGEIVLAAEGPTSALLLGERVALNLSARLSGVSTKTREIFAELAAHRNGRTPTLLETRKTTPGLRIYEKYATRIGGARNHRHGLDGGAMLKENHLRAVGNLRIAVQRLKLNVPVLTKIEVEVSNLEEFRIALEEGADVIMLDNFSIDDVHAAVAERGAKNSPALLEISGNLDTKNIKDIAQCGADFASVGALVHKALWVDMSLQFYS